MNSTLTLVLSISWALLSAPLVGAQGLSRYREFQIGMNLPALAKLANKKPSEAKMVHQRPEVIQGLESLAAAATAEALRLDEQEERTEAATWMREVYGTITNVGGAADESAPLSQALLTGCGPGSELL